jgi:hypothetical protein
VVEVIISPLRGSEMILWLTHQGLDHWKPLERMIEDAAGERGMHYSV